LTEGKIMDLLDLYERGTEWTASKIPAAAEQLGRATCCEDWDVRTLLNHTVDAQQYFAATARGEEAPLPSPNPPALIGDDPVAAYENIRQETLRAYRGPGVIEKTGPSLGIAFIDQLVHGWDLATSTGQDATMPDDLAAAAFEMLDGRLPDDRRAPGFKPAVPVPDTAGAREKLVAYAGRQP
jgi:uncharacterized protein (TIGR03086 family)